MTSQPRIVSFRGQRAPGKRLFEKEAETQPNRIVQAGQVIVLFALMLTVLIGLIGIAIDLTWAWRKGIEVQRAADAGALAGVVYLPGDLPGAQTRARAEVGRNGYGGSLIVAQKNPADDHQLDVTITADVDTFFVRLFNVDHWTITRKARAAYVLPVPMGSPENFYGVYCNIKAGTSTACPEGTSVPGAASTTVKSHGAWGAIQATGTDHGQGDAFIPLNDRTHSLGGNPHGGSNPDLDESGYNYGVELPAGGTIYVYDPTACAVGDGLGTGDHWNDGGGWESGPKVYSVSTYYKLYDMNSNPLEYSLQPLVADSAKLFEREYQYDQSGTYGSPSYRGNLRATSIDGRPLADCGAGRITNPSVGGYWHNKWWPIATVGPGLYRLNISSAAIGSVNWKATFENDFSIEAVGSSMSGKDPRVYGLGRMVQYNIIQGSGKQAFYLAQIGPENAGKTMQIDLFDIGDIGGSGQFRVLSPNGNAYNYASFTYSTDANCDQTSGHSDSCLNTAGTTVITTKSSGGGQSFNDTWLHIYVQLPGNYGCSVASPCLKPAGETQQGWWKIEYTTSAAANDTTTWMVSLRGNPVHLVPLD